VFAIFAVGADARAPLLSPQNSCATKAPLSPLEAAWGNVPMTVGHCLNEEWHLQR
jgi:hypothetical protein